MPQQQHIWDVALEFDADGRLAYDEVDLSTMRQTSKTTTMFVKQVWRLTRAARMWGPQRSTYTAQKRQMARNKLERDFAEILLRSPAARRSFTEIKNPKARPAKPSEWKISLNNGSEHMLFGRGNYLQIDAPTKTAGHGDTLDDGNIDEAFAHADDSVEQAMRPAQATRFNSQLWVGSTAGDETSFYWYGKVLAGRKAVEAGDDSRVAYFEWSIPEEADIDDEDVWWEYMPALGHTISPEFVRGELERARRKVDDGGESLWRRAYGNQWVRVPDIGGVTLFVIKPTEWTAVTDRSSVALDPVVFGVDSSPDREWSSIVVAANRASGGQHIEVIDHRPGVPWLIARLIELRGAWPGSTIVVDPVSPAWSIVKALEAKKVDVAKVTAQELAASCGAFLDAVVGYTAEGGSRVAPTLRYRPDDEHATAMAAAVYAGRKRSIGSAGAWAWSPKDSGSDITPLVAATLAFGALPSVDRESAYSEERGMTVIG